MLNGLFSMSTLFICQLENYLIEMTLRNSIAELGASLLEEKGRAKLTNERVKFVKLVETIVNKFPKAALDDGTLEKPYGSLVFLATIGQRPITSILILQILLEAKRRYLRGREVGEELAKKLGVSSTLTTNDDNYRDMVGDLISTFVKVGILEPQSPRKEKHPEEEKIRIREAIMPEVKAFLQSITFEKNVLDGFKPSSFKDLFETRFDKRLNYVIKSGTGEKQPFKIGKIMKSMLNPKLGISFEDTIAVIEEVEPQLEEGMKTIEIQSLLYNALKKIDRKAAENYRISYPGITSISMSDGEIETVNYKLVKTLIEKEVKLKLTRNLLDRLASTVYNVISRNPENYEHETVIREYVEALVRSECVYVRSASSFVREHLESAESALEGFRNTVESDEVPAARGLLGQFLEQISLVALVEFGYLPFRDFKQNVDLISNLLREEEIKDELKDEFQLKENDLFQFQRIRFLMQGKDGASKKTLEKMVGEGNELIHLCREILRVSSLRLKSKPMAAEVAEVVPIRRLATGYEDLDDLLLGGIPEEYTIILTSPSCDEKDLLIESFLEAGIGSHQITMYVTIDAKETVNLAEKFPSDFYLILCNPEADTIVKNGPNIFKLKGVENLTDLDITLTSFFRKLDEIPKGTRRACIEIISDALLQHHAVSTRRWLTALIPKLKSRGFTTLAVMNPHMHSPQEAQAILDLFQGEIQIYNKKTAKGMRRFLRIEKMYNQEYDQSEMHLKKERIQKSS